MTLRNLMALAATAVVMAQPLTAAVVNVAETTAGAVRLADLNERLLVADIALEGGPDTPEGRSMLAQMVRSLAFERVLVAEGAKRGLTTQTVAVRDRVVLDQREHLEDLAQYELITQQATIDQEVLTSRVEQILRDTTGPPTVAFRFMSFRDDRPGSPALERAREARTAVEAGEGFSTVAQRLASPQSTGRPGDIVGPMTLADPLPEGLRRRLAALPVRTLSDLVETSAGPMLLYVESRAEFQPPDRSLVNARIQTEMAVDARVALRQKLSAELREKHKVAFHPGAGPDDVFFEVGRVSYTRRQAQEMLRRVGAPVPSPEAVTVEIVEPFVEQELLLAEFAARGLDGRPEVRRKLNRIGEEAFLKSVVDVLAAERITTPTEAEVRAYFEANSESFARELWSFEVVGVGASAAKAPGVTATPGGMAGWAEALRRRFTEGGLKAAEGFVLDSGITDYTTGSFVNRALSGVPVPRAVEEALRVAQPGPAAGVMAVRNQLWAFRCTERGPKVPPLEEIRLEVAAAWMRERTPDIAGELLEQYGFRPLTDFAGWRLENGAVLPPE